MVTDIIEKGYVTGKPNVGIIMTDVSSEATLRYGIPSGVYIDAVLEGSCGEKAGLQVGDIITAINDTSITSANQLASAVKNYKAGDTVSFTIYRNQQTQTISVTLDENNTQREQAMAQLQEERQQSQQSSQQTQQGSGSSSWPFNFGW